MTRTLCFVLLAHVSAAEQPDQAAVTVSRHHDYTLCFVLSSHVSAAEQPDQAELSYARDGASMLLMHQAQQNLDWVLQGQ